MSIDIANIVERARISAADARKDGEIQAGDREQLKRIAAEFESMLLVQMLRDMRRAGAWEDDSQEDGSGGDLSALFETIDVELASHLSRVRGLGLSDELLKAFDRFASHAGTAGRLDVDAHAPNGPERVAPSRKDDVGLVDPGARVPPSTSRGVAIAATPAEPDLQPDTGPGASSSSEPRVRPVDGAVTSPFGWRRDPFTSQVTFHQGVDLRAAYGQEVRAAAAGKVVVSHEERGYGMTVVVEHPDRSRTRYAHLSAALVRPGADVSAGEPIGRVGRSGRATGPHLHFEVTGPDGRRVRPEDWARAVEPTPDGRGPVHVLARASTERHVSNRADRAGAVD